MSAAARSRKWRLANRDKHLASKRNYYARNAEKIREASRQWKRNNPEKKRAQKLKEHGFTTELFNRRKAEQSGLCAICSQPKKLGADHDHATGKPRGLLCNNCNAGLGFFKDSTFILGKAIGYLCQFKIH